MSRDDQADQNEDRGAAYYVRRFLFVGSGAYVGIAALLYVFQRFLIFPGGGPLIGEPPWPYEDVLLDVGGETTHAWYCPVDDAPGVVLMSHGNGENVSTFVDTIGLYRGLGFSTLAYDYGGYGKSTGKATEQRVYKDIRAAWDWLVEKKGYDPGQIVIYGRSIGGGPSVDLAQDVQPAALILESTFTSTVDVGKQHYPWLPIATLLRHRFDNLSKIGRVEAPVLIIHSPDDTIIPVNHGRALFDAANEPKKFLEIHGDHNEGFFLSQDLYRKEAGAFLDRVLSE